MSRKVLQLIVCLVILAFVVPAFAYTPIRPQRERSSM